MALHRKYGHLLDLKPDIAIIPECENVERLASRAPEFEPASSIWVGQNSKKGLGVFTFGAFSAVISPAAQTGIPYIVPVTIRGPVSFGLLAVWACHHKKDSYEMRLGPLARALGAYRHILSARSWIIAGDFNDNVKWDRPKRLNNHGTNVKMLSSLGFESAYHHDRAVDQGKEPEPTIFWRNRKIDGPAYHIDYCFVSQDWLSSITSVTLGTFAQWVGAGLSDHVPLSVDIDAPNETRA